MSVKCCEGLFPDLSLFGILIVIKINPRYRKVSFLTLTLSLCSSYKFIPHLSHVDFVFILPDSDFYITRLGRIVTTPISWEGFLPNFVLCQ
jgi:hypothetical protein